MRYSLGFWTADTCWVCKCECQLKRYEYTILGYCEEPAAPSIALEAVSVSSRRGSQATQKAFAKAKWAPSRHRYRKPAG